MSPDTASLTQRAVARDVMAWCRAEDMSVTRQLQRRLATPVHPAETLVQLDLDDTAVLIYVDRIEVRMPHRTAAWAAGERWVGEGARDMTGRTGGASPGRVSADETQTYRYPKLKTTGLNAGRVAGNLQRWVSGKSIGNLHLLFPEEP